MQRAVWAPVRDFYKKTPFQRPSSAHRRAKPRTRNSFLVEGQGKGSPCFSRFTEGFASAEATKGLSDRPLETFGVPLLRMGGAA